MIPASRFGTGQFVPIAVPLGTEWIPVTKESSPRTTGGIAGGVDTPRRIIAWGEMQITESNVKMREFLVSMYYRHKC